MEKGKVVLLGNFNVTIGRFVQIKGVIGEDTCNASENRLKSTRGKLEVLRKHYLLLGKMSVDSEFDANGRRRLRIA